MQARSCHPYSARTVAPPVAEGTESLVLWMTGLSRRQAWPLTILVLAVIGLADYVTGPDFWFGPIYLLAICLPAWALGRSAAFFAGFTSSALSYSLNNWADFPHSELATIWNLSMRLVAVLIVVVLVTAFRRSFDREWQRSRHDPLTGALTRQAFDERTLQVAHPAGSWALLAYIDLDGFKRINDRYGHAAGDEVLRSFAATALAGLDPRAAFARIGGDEFLLFVPVGDRDGGFHAAQLWYDRLNQSQVCAPFACQCSMGALVLDAAGMTIDDVKRADRLMYAAKGASGPRLRIAERDGATPDAPIEASNRLRGFRLEIESGPIAPIQAQSAA